MKEFTHAERVVLYDRLSAHSSATLHEAGGKIGALPAAIKPIVRGMRVQGEAWPVAAHAFENLTIHQAIAVAPVGCVLCVTVEGAYEAGYFGEIMAVAAQARNVAGLVIDGFTRDLAEIERLGFPVFSRGLSIRGTGKTGGGAIGPPVKMGDVTISVGDVIVGDDDGVVAFPYAMLEQMVAKAEARIETERTIMERLRAGETTLDIYGFGR